MEQIILQPILFPIAGICADETLYFHRGLKHTSYFLSKPEVGLDKLAILRFDTYFNSFSMKKWLKYTTLDTVSIRIRIRGSMRVLLLSQEYINSAVVETMLLTQNIESQTPKEFELEFPRTREGIYSFVLESTEDEGVFYGGAYVTQADPASLRDVAMALNICTYHREKYIRRTLQSLETFIFQNPVSPLSDRLHVYVTDNGGTLDAREFDEPYLHLAALNECGSSGGFAGGETRILADREALGLTHMIFMDDDILLDPRILERNYQFLRFIRDEYRDALLGGALLHLNFQRIQIESGALWRSGRITGTKPPLDLSRTDQVLFNEIETGTNYQGWWYSCVPLHENSGKDMPFPFYFHRDDVEFGMRHQKLIFLNGISIWHEPFENKPNSYAQYYDTRNMLIVNSFYCPDYKNRHFRRDIIRLALTDVLNFRYKEAELVLRGFEDFLKGIDWVMEHNGKEYFQSIVQAGYQEQDLEQLPFPPSLGQFQQYQYYTSHSPKWKRFLRLIAGFVLPANRTITVPAFRPSIYCFFRVKCALNYNPTTNKGFITQKSIRQIWRLFWRIIGTCLRHGRSYEKAAQGWRERKGMYTNLSFWEKRLAKAQPIAKELSV